MGLRVAKVEGSGLHRGIWRDCPNGESTGKESLTCNGNSDVVVVYKGSRFLNWGGGVLSGDLVISKYQIPWDMNGFIFYQAPFGQKRFSSTWMVWGHELGLFQKVIMYAC